MTTIVIRKSDLGNYHSFSCMGHAGYARKGKDIVCSAISILVVNTINSLEEFCHTDMKVDTNESTGFIQCIFKEKNSDDEKLLLDAMVKGLMMISKEYGKKYCEVKFEEV